MLRRNSLAEWKRLLIMTPRDKVIKKRLTLDREMFVQLFAEGQIHEQLPAYDLTPRTVRLSHTRQCDLNIENTRNWIQFAIKISDRSSMNAASDASCRLVPSPVLPADGDRDGFPFARHSHDFLLAPVFINADFSFSGLSHSVHGPFGIVPDRTLMPTAIDHGNTLVAILNLQECSGPVEELGMTFSRRGGQQSR